MKKKILRTLAIVLVLALTLPCAAFAAGGTKVAVNGASVVWTDAEPFIDANSRTLVPLRAVADAMGVKVRWDAANRTAFFTRTSDQTDANGKACVYTETIGFPIDSTTADGYLSLTYADGTVSESTITVDMDTAAVIASSRTYAPIRYLAEFFDFIVGWDAASRTVTIDSTYNDLELYDAAGLAVYLPADMQLESDPNFTLFYANDNCMMCALKQDFKDVLAPGAAPASVTVADYAAAVQDANGFTEPFTADDYGNLATTYLRTVEGVDFFYYSTVRKGADAFWLVSFACYASQRSVYLPQFELWGDGIAVD